WTGARWSCAWVARQPRHPARTYEPRVPRGGARWRGNELSSEHRLAVKQMVMETITRKTDRDEQKSVGPSELGTACDYCVGLALTRKYPEYGPVSDCSAARHGFGLNEWVGTAELDKLVGDIVSSPYTDTYVVE